MHLGFLIQAYKITRAVLVLCILGKTGCYGSVLAAIGDASRSEKQRRWTGRSRRENGMDLRGTDFHFRHKVYIVSGGI